VFKGDRVKKGQQLTEGPIIPQEILEVSGPQELQKYLVDEVQQVYRLQGVEINDKHIEIIVRQMLRKVRVKNPGDTGLLWGDEVDRTTLDRINKGYHAEDIIEQCGKLREAGIDFWMTFLNGTAGKEHSRDHAINSAIIFSQCKPMLVGTGGLTLFPGTPLLEEAQRGEFSPLSEKDISIHNKNNTKKGGCK
jgi:hypothetical protein